jgi:hypothetical protein
VERKYLNKFQAHITVTRYEFDGSQYIATTTKEIKGDDETEALYQALKSATKWQVSGKKP